jgi:hypothetical protein
MNDDRPDDPGDERSEHDRELYAAVLFRIKQNLEKLALDRGKLNPRRATREKIQTSPHWPGLAHGKAKRRTDSKDVNSALSFFVARLEPRSRSRVKIHRGPFFAPHEGRHFSSRPSGRFSFLNSGLLQAGLPGAWVAPSEI